MKSLRGIVALTTMLAVICVAGHDCLYGKWIRVAVSADEKSDPNNATPSTQELIRELYPGGKIKSETPLAGGKIHGKKKIFSENGIILKEEEYREGKREGLSLEYYEDGTLKNHEVYKDDRLSGDCFTNYPNGQKMMAGQCIEGKKAGKWILYHSNGNKYMEGNYADGFMEGQWRSYSPEGWLDSEGEYRNGLQWDLWVYFDKNKKIMKKVTMKNGMIDGPCWIYSQGRLTGEGIMNGLAHDPKKNGAWKAYYQNGRLKYEGVFTMGVKSGTFVEYYSNGSKKGTGDYANDRRNGNWVFYAKDGVTVDVENSGQYVNGKLKKQ